MKTKVRLIGLLASAAAFLLLGAYLYFTFMRPREVSMPLEEAGPLPVAPGTGELARGSAPTGPSSVEPLPAGYEAWMPVFGAPATSAKSVTAIKVSLARKLIREAWLTLSVQDVPKTVQQIRQIVEQLDGYVASASQSREPEGEWSAELVLRVPLERYQEALTRLQGLGQVENLRESVQDVTEEFIDLEARLRNLKRSEQHLLELLKRTGKVSDLLQVERELSQRRSEIERIEGRLRYLTHQTTFSTIHVMLREFRARPIPGTAFSIPKVFADAFRTVVVVLRIVLVIAIWVLVFGIIWIPITVVAWLLTRKRRRPKEAIAAAESK